MEPLAIVTVAGAALTQLGLIVLRCGPAYNFVQRLIDCLRHPHPPPPVAVTMDGILRAVNRGYT